MNEPILLVQPRGHASPLFDRVPALRLRSESAIRDAGDRHARHALWLAPSAPAVDLLLTALAGHSTQDSRLLVVGSTKAPRTALLHALFRFIVSSSDGIQLVPTDELAEILSSPERQDLIVGGSVSREDNAIVLYRGNIEPLVVPLSWFRTRPGGPTPDLSDLQITDYGRTVRLGQYEASTDAILFEYDAQYRRRAKKRQIQQDHSIGGSLRRLRLQKALPRTAFSGISAKEVARIERGEVKAPHPKTLAVLAKRLGVSPGELPSY